MAPTSCPQCQSSSIQRESVGSEEFYMCLDCGTIVEEINNLSHNSTNSVLLVENSNGQLVVCDAPKPNRNAGGVPQYLINRTTTSRGKTRGILKTKEFCKVLQLPRDCCDEAVSLFKTTYYHEEIYKKTIGVKDTVSAACVYIAARKQDMPITLTFMAQMTGVKLAQLAWHYLFVMRVNKVTVPPLNMAALVVKTMSTKGLDKKVIQMTQKLLVLCNAAWISHSRHPDTCIPAATYLCWLASDSCHSIKVSYTKFCEQFNIPVNSRQRVMVKMIRDVLKLMAEKIPWITKVDEKTLIAELPTIIDHQTSLLKEAFSTRTSEEDRALLPPWRKRKRTSEEYQEEDIANASEAAKRHKFLHSTSLDESEFVDEMPEHIYTEEEVKRLEPFRAYLESEESEEEEEEEEGEEEEEEEIESEGGFSVSEMD